MKTIIPADDDAVFRMVMKRHLGRLGFAVIENTSGKGVLEQIRTYQPVACMVDIVMDEKEGIETILEISELPQKPKIIAVSSNPAYLKMAAEFGTDAALLKPISLDLLSLTLEQLGILAS